MPPRRSTCLCFSDQLVRCDEYVPYRRRDSPIRLSAGGRGAGRRGRVAATVPWRRCPVLQGDERRLLPPPPGRRGDAVARQVRPPSTQTPGPPGRGRRRGLALAQPLHAAAVGGGLCLLRSGAGDLSVSGPESCVVGSWRSCSSRTKDFFFLSLIFFFHFYKQETKQFTSSSLSSPCAFPGPAAGLSERPFRFNSLVSLIFCSHQFRFAVSPVFLPSLKLEQRSRNQLGRRRIWNGPVPTCPHAWLFSFVIPHVCLFYLSLSVFFHLCKCCNVQKCAKLLRPVCRLARSRRSATLMRAWVCVHERKCMHEFACYLYCLYATHLCLTGKPHNDNSSSSSAGSEPKDEDVFGLCDQRRWRSGGGGSSSSSSGGVLTKPYNSHTPFSWRGETERGRGLKRDVQYLCHPALSHRFISFCGLYLLQFWKAVFYTPLAVFHS